MAGTDLVTHPLFGVSHMSLHGTNIYAPAFMPRLRPLRTWFGNLNYKGDHVKGDPPQNQCGTEGSEAGAPPLAFGEEGCQLVLHIDEGNATLN
eukprot:8381239-Ditylum_brightwellii.AAC.1